jgi:hypothetical protein
MVIEPLGAPGVVGKIGQDIPIPNRETLIRDILRVNELDGVDILGFGNENRTAQTIQVPTREQTHHILSLEFVNIKTE